MKILLNIILLTLVYSISALSQNDDYFDKYKNYSLLNVLPKTEQHLDLLVELKEKFSLDLWTDIRTINRRVDIMVSPQMKDFMLNTLKQAGLNVQVSIEDISKEIKQQHMLSTQIGDDFDYGKYHTLDEIHAWIDQIQQTYPKFVTILNITKSYEGRNLKAFKISIPSADNKAKPAMWFDGGIHAREWISPATVIYVAYSVILLLTIYFKVYFKTFFYCKFLSKYGTDTDVTQILNNFDFYILPVFNVDGYVYTFEKVISIISLLCAIDIN
jgi:hypothetical protein